MNLDFSDEQKMLKEQARKFLSQTCPIERVRKALETGEDYAEDVWKGLADLGFMGAAIPETYGGLGLSTLELCVVAEEIGRAVAPVPFSSSIYFAAEGLKCSSDENAKKTWLPKIASGEIVAAFAIAEGPAIAADPRLNNTRFENGKLSGEKYPVADGMRAHIALVTAQTPSGPVIVLADLADKGVQRQNLKTIDPSRQHASIVFDSVPASPLSPPQEGMSLIDHILNRAAVLLAFEQIGGADAALQMASEYARERYAFGRPIGSFQAVKHKLADIYIHNQIARANAYHAAMTLAENSPDLPAAAASARVAASHAYTAAAQENVQIHGGIGFTWESDCQFHYRRARLLSHAAGTPMRWRERLVKALETRNIHAA